MDQNQQPIQQNDDTMQKFIPTKNMPSLIGYYCGVFGLIPFLGIPLAVAAIILGSIGLSKYKTNPTPGAKAHAITALVLGIIEVVIFTGFFLITFVLSR